MSITPFIGFVITITAMFNEQPAEAGKGQ